MDVVGVEDRDDEDRADVVDDGEREQEQLQRRRDAAAEQAEHADGHRDVGGHRDAPAVDGVAAGVDREVDQGGDQHPADRGDGRERGASGLPQLALDELALDLEPDDEEEQRHQPVVDPLAQRQVERATSDAHVEVCGPQVDVARLPRRVGPDQRDDGRGDEDDTARRSRCGGSRAAAG